MRKKRLEWTDPTTEKFADRALELMGELCAFTASLHAIGKDAGNCKKLIEKEFCRIREKTSASICRVSGNRPPGMVLNWKDVKMFCEAVLRVVAAELETM
jgi:hypothetical protein